MQGLGGRGAFIKRIVASGHAWPQAVSLINAANPLTDGRAAIDNDASTARAFPLGNPGGVTAIRASAPAALLSPAGLLLRFPSRRFAGNR